MSVFDYVLPHRLLLNSSLQKRSEELRVRIDEYQIEYDNKVKACQNEIKRVEADTTQKIISYKNELEHTLIEDKRRLNTEFLSLAEYIELSYSFKEI